MPDDKRIAEAKQALEGPEWAAKREQETKIKTLQTEGDALIKRLDGLKKEKEALELAWIEQDNQRRALRIVLNPIVEAEKGVEEEEAGLENEEAKIGLAADKHAVEEKRWAVETKRKEVEQKRWVEEEKLEKIEKVIETNTLQYRRLLDEEDQIGARLGQIKKERL